MKISFFSAIAMGLIASSAYSDEVVPTAVIFDEGSEKRDRYTIAMAVEDPEPDNLPEGVTHNGMRVVLLADREVFSDAILGRVAVVQNMLVDIIKWTGGEEAFSGETNSEKDKRIEHTKSQDAIWFWGTMVGAPMLMLGIGLLFIGRRRRRSRVGPNQNL